MRVGETETASRESREKGGCRRIELRGIWDFGIPSLEMLDVITPETLQWPQFHSPAHQPARTQRYPLLGRMYSSRE
jgi:hypothetical protein